MLMQVIFNELFLQFILKVSVQFGIILIFGQLQVDGPTKLGRGLGDSS
jgi:hypothetical protein